MFYPDLSPYCYDELDEGDEEGVALNVGWLTLSESFVSASAPPGLLERLRLLSETPVNLTRGEHLCEFCVSELRSPDVGPRSDAEVIAKLRERNGFGNGEIRVEGDEDVVFYAPTLIVHYVEMHKYCPPPAFINAVMGTES